MKENLNDVNSGKIQEKENKLNEILNSVDSKLKPDNKISGWEDEINSVLEKRSRNTDIDEILKGISPVPEEKKKNTRETLKSVGVISPENDVQELIDQITVGKKIAELNQQKKADSKAVTAEDIIREFSGDLPEKKPEKTEVPRPAKKPENAEKTQVMKKMTYRQEKEGDTIVYDGKKKKANTIVYNLEDVKLTEKILREAMNAPATEVRKPVRKMVRVEKPKDYDPTKMPVSVNKRPPEKSQGENVKNNPVNQEKNITKTAPVKKSAPDKKPVKAKKTKKKKSLKEKFIELFPNKKDPALEKIRKVVFLCSICAIVVCGYMVGDYYIDLGKSKRLHEKIASIYEPYNPPGIAENVATIYEPDYERTYSLLDGARKLLDMNPDVVGYITIPDTPIANPVMQSGDNEKYLDQNINGDKSRAGELFLDYRNNFDRVRDSKLVAPNSDNLVIYGHNMANDTMFGCLKYYQRNYNYYKENPIIYFNSNYECYTYKIFSYFIVDALDTSETAYDCWNKFDFNGEEDFYNFVNEAKKRSLALNDVDVKYGDKLLTLSTCNTILGDRGRLIVMGRLLRDGEDAREGTETNVQNNNIKWPSIYYQQKPNERYNPDAEFIPYG